MAHPRRLVRTVCVVLGLASLLIVALAGCNNGSTTVGNQQPVRGKTLNLGLESDLNTLDPLTSSLLVEREVMLNLYDTLLRVDATNTIQPDLATSLPTYSTDAKTLTFTLRSDVTFQDGTPFNADAVKYNMDRYLNTPNKPGSTNQRKSEISTISSVTVVDSTHVQFNLSKPFAPLLATLTDRSGMMLSPTALKAASADVTNKPTNMGSGPFSFKEWTKGDHISIVANKSYWRKDSSSNGGGALPYLDGVTYKIITNTSVMFQNLQGSNIDIARVISPQDVATAKGNSSLIYKQIPGLSFGGFELNTKKAPLDDIHVRHAIAWAVNPNEILTSVLLGIGIKSNGPIPPSISWAYDATIAPYHTDVNQAKAELALAQPANQHPSFDLKIAANDPTTATEAQFIQSELQAAGITVNLKPEVFGTIITETNNHDFQAALVGWSGRVDPDGNMYSWFHTGQSNNTMQYSNAAVDQALDDARTQSTLTARAMDYQTAEKQIVMDASYIFITHGVSSQISSNKVHGFTLLPTTIIDCSTIWLG